MKHPDSVAQRYTKLCEAYLCLNEAFDKLDQSHSRLQHRFKQLFGYFSAAQQALVQLPILQQRIEQSDRRLHSLREELQAKEARLGELIANYDQVCGELDSTKAELLGAQALIEKLEAENAQVLECLSRLTGLEEELASLRERLNHAETARQALEARNRELEAALGERDRQVDSLQERLAQLEQENASLKAQLLQVEGLLTEDSINLLQETEKAVEADKEVLPLVLASLPETERLMQEVEQLLSSCIELAHLKPQAA